MAVDFLNIPGNIRQQYMPFTLNGPGQTQLFTYKPTANFANKGIIHPFSKNLAALIANDSSFQYTHGPNGKKIEYADFLNLIPGIQIREFVPDAKLTQTFKWLSYFSKGFDAALKNLDSEASTGFTAAQKLLEDAWKGLSDNMKGLTSGNAPLLAKVVGGMTSYYRDRGFNVGPDAGLAVLTLPFLLYYRLTTTYTNNVYEIPYSMQNNIFESDGTYGWGDDGGTDFPFLDVLGNKAAGLVKAIAPGLGSTLKVNAMPSFSPTGTAASTSFEIHFDLVNDSDEAAIYNFLLCHTLFGNNRWLQYGFVQTGASLYDVKFPGANRFFMCKGRFVCKGKGAFRTPSDSVIQGIVAHHGKKNLGNTIEAAWRKTVNGTSVAQEIGRQEALRIIDSEINKQEQNGAIQGKNLKRDLYNDLENEDVQSHVDAAINTSVKRAAQTKISSQDTRFVPFEDKTAFDTKIEVNGKTYNITEAIVARKEALEKVASIKEDISRAQKTISKEKDNRYIIGEQGKNLPKIQKEVNELYEKIKNPDLSQAEKDRMSREINSLNSKITSELEKRVEIFDDEAYDVNYFRNQLRNNPNQFVSESDEKVASITSSLPSYETYIANLQNQANGYQNLTGDNVSTAVQRRIDNIATALGENAVSKATETLNTSSSIWKDLIKIPDVYSITLSFTSLIPDNFNSYMYGWRGANLDPIENFLKDPKKLGVMEDLVNNLVNNV